MIKQTKELRSISWLCLVVFLLPFLWSGVWYLTNMASFWWQQSLFVWRFFNKETYVTSCCNCIGFLLVCKLLSEWVTTTFAGYCPFSAMLDTVLAFICRCTKLVLSVVLTRARIVLLLFQARSLSVRTLWPYSCNCKYIITNRHRTALPPRYVKWYSYIHALTCLLFIYLFIIIIIIIIFLGVKLQSGMWYLYAIKKIF